jgi:RHS repeat-associated protein
MSSTIIIRAWRAGRLSTRGAALRWLGGLVSLVLLVAGVQAVTASPALAAAGGKGLASGPVSNAFAMGDGIGGSVNQRTGAFQVSVPLVNVTGPAGTGLSLALSYDQSLAALGGAGDRFGLGAGWTLGVPWVDTAGGVHVFPASGGSYAYDTSAPTGLAGYPLRDLSFAKDPGETQPPPGVAVRPYVYTLTLLDGTVDRFDANGNLIEQSDRFGNAIDVGWQQSGSWWQPVWVADSYGQVTRFAYTGGEVTVTAPPTAEGITATTTLHLDVGRLTGVTDAVGQATSFGYAPVTGQAAELLDSVTSPAGEHTSVTYESLGYEPGVAAVSTVEVTDAHGNPVLPELRFDISPPGDDQHNYTGYPDYNQNGPNGLFDSGDFGYRYTTALSDGTSTVEATYNSLHLLVAQKVYVRPPGGAQVLDQAQAYTYPAVSSVASLPANYAKPTAVTVTYGDPQFGPTRTVTTTAAYNDQGEQTSATDAAGTTTTTTYGSYGLPVTQTVTGKDGATSVTTNTLTADGKQIATTTAAVGTTAKTATARTVTTYSYNSLGQVTGQLLAWAPGAKPSVNSGPDHLDTTQQIGTDTAAHTETTVVTTAAGTPAAASTTTVTDLVTGQVLRQTSPSGLTTSYTYDALGRPVTVTAPGGQVTKTVYDSPTVTTVTAPSGLVTQTTTDVAGRTVKVTDNVSGEKLVADPAARTVQTDSYSPDGTQQTTTTAAGTITTTLDPLGLPVKVVSPDGITQVTAYDNVTNTRTTSVVPAGGSPAGAVSTTVQGFNDVNQPLSSVTSYADGTPKVAAAQSYDGLGRVTSASAAGITVTPSYGGAGGLEDQATLTPTDTSVFPGDPVSAATTNTMTGAPLAKTLTQGGQATSGDTYTYDDAGRVATVTTPAGARTAYTYAPGGQIATITQPSGTTTTYTYDPATGRLAETDVTAPDGHTEKTAYTYDPATGLVTAMYNPDDPADKITYDHDADGHVTAIHYPDGTSVTASYTDAGQLAATTDITGAVTTYTYNPDAGQAGGCGPSVTDLCQAVQARDGTTLARVAYTYDSLDRVHTITRGTGITTTLAYTDANQVKTETTTAPDGTVLVADSYTYDAHGNLASATTQTTTPAAARDGRPARHGGRGGTAATTTTYSYDAYNRLIGSATYDGTTATGTPATQTSYTLNSAGDVVKKVATTGGATTTTVNTISPGDQLTSQTVNGTTTRQAYDADGNVTRDLAGNTYTYTPAGQTASVTTPTGAVIRYAYWPDHTLRSATTTAGQATATFHDNTAGQIANDTYTDGSGPAVTGSYLIGLGREARALIPSTGPAQTTGPGTGYYLVDPHGSVQALVDPGGQVTTAYAYTDYGIPTTTALPAPRSGVAAAAAVNPFGYDGAYTSPVTGTQYLPARTYDPAQGRFLSLDSSAQINRYQAFNTNPVNFTDPTGQYSVPDLITDIFVTLVFAVTLVASAGVAVGAVAAAVAAGEEAGAAAVAGAVLTTAGTVATAGAAVSSAVLTADDAAGLSGKGFLSASQRSSLQVTETALGIAGAAAGLGGYAAAGGAEAEAGVEAADAAKRFAVDELDPGVSPASESSSPVGFNESIGPLSETAEPNSEIAAWRDTLDWADTSTTETNNGFFDTGPAMDEAAAMRQDDLWEYAPGDQNGYPSWPEGDDAESGGVSSMEDAAMSSSESGPAWQSVLEVTPPSATTSATPGPGPGLTLNSPGPALAQSVEADFALVFNSDGELTVYDPLNEPAIMSSLSGSLPY